MTTPPSVHIPALVTLLQSGEKSIPVLAAHIYPGVSLTQTYSLILNLLTSADRAGVLLTQKDNVIGLYNLEALK
jgi:hypothetical protein